MAKDGVTNLQIMVDGELFPLSCFYIYTASILEKGINHQSN